MLFQLEHENWELQLVLNKEKIMFKYLNDYTFKNLLFLEIQLNLRIKLIILLFFIALIQIFLMIYYFFFLC